MSVCPDNEAQPPKQQPLERRLATHFGTTLVIFKAIIILHFGGMRDIYKEGRRLEGLCDPPSPLSLSLSLSLTLRFSHFVRSLSSLAIIQVHRWQRRLLTL